MKNSIPIVAIILILLVPISNVVLNQESDNRIDFIPSPEGFNDIPPETVIDMAFTAKFSANDGQVQDRGLLYYALGANLSVGFGRGWLSFKVDGESSSVVRRTFVGCNDVVPVGSKPTEERSSYFIGNDPEGWVTDVRNFRELLYEDIYDGIDLRIHLTEGSLKYEFIVDPGSDPSRIQMLHEGMEDIRLSRGDLVIETVNGVIIDEAPFSYQAINGKEILIGSEYSIDGPNIRISLDAYDPGIQLVIDPSINFSTLIGGNSRDLLRSHYVDADGNVYLTGASLSLDFPTTPGVFNRTMNSYGMAFVTKLSPDGSSLKYSTFIGGAASLGYGYAIWVDTSGNAYVTGIVQGRDFPTTPGNFSHVGDDLANIMIFKLNATGSSLIFSSILGAKDVTSDFGYDVLVDDAGMIYIVGQTGSLRAFCPSDSYQDRTKGNGDAFVLKLAPTGKTILNCTHLGGREKDRAESIAIDSDGNVIIVGWTLSTDLPVSSNAFCSTKNGEADAFVAVFDENLTNLTYSSYFGGVNNDFAYDISVDSDDSIYVTGSGTYGFPTTSGAFDEVLNGSYDAFVLKIDGNDSLEYSTFLGGKDGEIGYAVTVYDGGCALVSGYTTSSDFPTTSDAYDRQKAGWHDVFMTKLNPDGSEILYSTFIGGQGDEYVYEISVPDGGFVYLSGKTEHNTFPTTQGAYCTTYQGGDWDGFLLRLDIDRPWMFNDSTPNRTTTGDPFQVNLTVRDNTDVSEVRLEYWYGSSSNHTRVAMDMTGGTNTNATYVSNLTTPSDSLAKFYYIVHMKDAAGNSNSTGVTNVTVLDNDRPLMTDWTSQMPTTGETFRFAVDVFDNIHMDDVRVVYWFGDSVHEAVNVSMWGTTGTGNGLYDYDAVTIPLDSVRPLHYRFWCNDTSGNWNETGIFELHVVDNDLPHIGDDLSDANATTGDPLTFMMNCSDNIGPAVVRVAFWYNEGTPVHRNLTMEALDTDDGGNGSYGLVWSVFPDAVHAIHYRFHVSDGAGNVNLTFERVINVTDDDRPSFHEDSSDSTASTGEDFTFQIVVSDNIDIADVTVSYWFGEGPATNLSMALRSIQGPGRYVYSLTVHIPAVIPGQLSYHFTATDGSGNANVSQDRTVTIDDTSPPGIIDDQTDGVATTGDPFTFKVVVEDNVGVQGVTVVWRLEEGPEEHLDMEPLGPANPNRATYFIEVDIPSDGTGSIEYSFQIIDTAGNQWTSSSRTVTIIDNDPPTLMEDLTAGTAIKGHILTLSVRFEDNILVDGVWAEHWYGDGERVNESMTLGGVYTFEVTTPRSPSGPLHYRFLAVDGAGNWATSEVGTVSLVNSPPVIGEVPPWDVVEEEESTLDLSPYITDANDPPGAIVVTCEDALVTVDRLVLLVLVEDWIPERTITVTISDGEDEVSASFVMRVQNINDPPEVPEILGPEDGSRYERGQEVALEVSYVDPDTMAGQVLTVTWSSDRDGEIGRFTSDSPEDVTTTILSPGDHRITVTVDDGKETSSAFVKITVYEDDDGTGSVFTPVTSILILVVIIVAVLGAVVIWMRYRGGDEP